jgi:hypothetical protein
MSARKRRSGGSKARRAIRQNKVKEAVAQWFILARLNTWMNDCFFTLFWRIALLALLPPLLRLRADMEPRIGLL